MLARSITYMYISKGLHAFYWVHTCIRTMRSVTYQNEVAVWVKNRCNIVLEIC